MVPYLPEPLSFALERVNQSNVGGERKSEDDEKAGVSILLYYTYKKTDDDEKG